MKYFLLTKTHITRLQEAYIQLQKCVRDLNPNSQAYVDVHNSMKLISKTIASDRYTKSMMGKKDD